MAIGSHSPLGRRGRMPISADINVTSLMDIAFVLLIIFMITAPLMQGGVDVQLPKAVARPLSAKEALTISVRRDGRVFIDRDGMSFEEFRASFPAIVARRQPRGVYLRGDENAPYGAVARVLAIIQQSGVSEVGLVTEDDRR